MKEIDLKIGTILIILGIMLIVLGLVVGLIQASKESYCNSLELAEYLENKECRRIIER